MGDALHASTHGLNAKALGRVAKAKRAAETIHRILYPED